jgi:CheY-like chemotaxis protein
MHVILVADDSTTIQQAIAIALDKEPFTVVKAMSGAECIAKAKDAKPALVLLDHQLGDQSGKEVIAALRADPTTEHIPVVLLPNIAMAFDDAQAQLWGVAGFVVKPFDCQNVVDRLRATLSLPPAVIYTSSTTTSLQGVGIAGSAVAVPATTTSSVAMAGGAVAASTGLSSLPMSLPRPPGLTGLTGSTGLSSSAAQAAQAQAAQAQSQRASTPLPTFSRRQRRRRPRRFKPPRGYTRRLPPAGKSDRPCPSRRSPTSTPKSRSNPKDSWRSTTSLPKSWSARRPSSPPPFSRQAQHRPPRRCLPKQKRSSSALRGKWCQDWQKRSFEKRSRGCSLSVKNRRWMGEVSKM